jgi:hypothetical protein
MRHVSWTGATNSAKERARSSTSEARLFLDRFWDADNETYGFGELTVTPTELSFTFVRSAGERFRIRSASERHRRHRQVARLRVFPERREKCRVVRPVEHRSLNSHPLRGGAPAAWVDAKACTACCRSGALSAGTPVAG